MTEAWVGFDSMDFCGCCGNEIENGDPYWCERCSTHVGHWTGHLWDKTYFAIHGEDCPFQVPR